MASSRIIVVVAFLALLAVPFVFRPATPPPPPGAERLIIITPHNEQIRHEFSRTFNEWHEREYGERVNVIYSVPGGTSEIRAMLQAQFTAALEAGRDPGGDADLIFGGGTYEHSVLKRGVTVTIDGEQRQVPITAPVDFEDDWLDEVYGPNEIGDGILYDPEKYWFGTALSGFGIVYNRDALRTLDLPEPTMWEELAHPRLRGWVALVNPSQSGSITTAFDTILQRRGWAQGWQILRRAGANSRYFSAVALKPPNDVSQGNAAMGVCIDFYGRYQSQAIIDAGGGDRVGYIDPPGATTIDADPISKLRGAPNPKMARRFIEFTLTEEAQALWQFRTDDDHEDGLGPARFELRRMPVLRSMYEKHFDRLIDPVNPFETARPAENPNRNFRSFVAIVFAAAAMDSHNDLRRAWRAIVNHPAYPAPRVGEMVTAADVTDPTLKRMLELFDAMPEVRGPGGRTYSMANVDDLETIRNGWLRQEWRDEALWHPESRPGDALRREFVQFFRANYREIVRIAEEGRM
ncbi:MAG: extracellular solute-binding protein [Phycisphaerales bacterium]|nr:MAG: extracellular solute-binding protein [Phycisphaerales bacterium]